MEVAPRYELLTQRQSKRAIMPIQCTFNIAILLYGLGGLKWIYTSGGTLWQDNRHIIGKP